MPFNPFNGDGTSLEREDPISGAAKQAAKAVNQGTQQQAKAANQSFVDQLYGNVSSPEALDPSADPLQAKTQPTASAPSGPMPAANPNEQSKLDETRRKLAELQSLHKKTYYDVTFGETAQKKRQQREEEELQLKQQEEEEQRMKEEEEKAKMAESMQAFQSHGKNGKGPDQLSSPVAVTQAMTKTESNRGSSG